MEPNFAPYDRLLEQLLALSNQADVLGVLDIDESLLNTNLLKRLEALKFDQQTDEDQFSYAKLESALKYSYGVKCLNTVLGLESDQDFFSFAQFNKSYIFTDDIYSTLEDSITTHSEDSDLRKYLQTRKRLLMHSAALTFFLENWSEKRRLMLEGLNWLTQESLKTAADSLKKYDSTYTDIIQNGTSLWVQVQEKGAAKIIQSIDLEILLKRINETTGEERLQAVYKALPLVDNPELQARLLATIGVELVKATVGNREDNLERAIEAFEKALEVFAEEPFTYEWAGIQSYLGAAYCDRLSGHQIDNLERAIQASKKALEVYTKEAFAQEWAMTQNNLANAYIHRLLGNKADNLELAIDSFEKALEVHTQEAFSKEWATIQNNLGNAYRVRLLGNDAENLELAIKACEKALEVYTREALPQEWAMAQNNLGNAYFVRLRGDKVNNLELAITAFERAVEVYTRETSAQKWATIQNNLGNAYRVRLLGSKVENLELAIKACEKALEVYTPEAFPQEWAMAQNNLGNAYFVRLRGDKVNNLELAITAFERAVEVYTRETSAQKWATIQNNLGNAYRDRLRGDGVENFGKSIEAYKKALEVFSQEVFAQDWAMTQNNLGNAYLQRQEQDKAVDFELAIEAYMRALKVYTREVFPQEWAMTQNNLGNAYFNRLLGDKAENFEIAIEAFKRALEVRTREAFAYDWAKTQNNLANAYSNRILGKRIDNLVRAIEAYEKALEVSMREAIPQYILIITKNLGVLYYEQKLYAKAQLTYEEAHKSLNLLRATTNKAESRTLLAHENSSLYQDLVHCCLVQGAVDKALEYAIVGKSRTVTEQIAAEKYDLNTLLKREPGLQRAYQVLEQEQEKLTTLIATLQLPVQEADTRDEDDVRKEREISIQQVRHLQETINRYNNDLLFNYPELSGVAFLPSLSLSEVQALAGELQNIPIIEYIQHGGGWGAFIVSGEETHYVALAEDLFKHIEESIDYLVNTNKNGSIFWRLPDYPQRLQILYHLLFEPLVPYLPASGQIVLAPTQLLHLVPFQALMTQDGRYISEQYAFSFVPSISTLYVLNMQRKRAKKAAPALRKVLSVSYASSGDGYLPNALTEAKAIESHFDNFVELFDENAHPKEVLKHANGDFFEAIHFSCHGSFDFSNPQGSGLLLANQEFLTINDIRMQMRLKGRPLVSLSACQTGQVKPELGDEVIGISWSFIVAGASAVVSSQWPVPDTSTRELFEHFYQFRREASLSDAEALQKAMAKLREKSAYKDRPLYWAGFYVMGLPIA